MEASKENSNPEPQVNGYLRGDEGLRVYYWPDGHLILVKWFEALNGTLVFEHEGGPVAVPKYVADEFVLIGEL